MTRPRSPLAALHAANLLTYGAIGAALAAIAAAQHGRRSIAGAAIAVAAIADTFDGRFARRFARTDVDRRLGGELDSLADAIVFGAAPIVVMAMLAPPAGWIATWSWWIGAVVYVIASLTRLSYFNVAGDDDRFVGLPAPAAGLIWSTALIWPTSAVVVSVLFVVCAAMMVAPVAFARPRGAGLALFALWAVGLVGLHTARI